MFARRAESVHQQYAGDDFASFFIIESPAGGGAPSRDDCRNIQRQNNLTMPVLYDRLGRLQSAGLSARHTHFVLDDQGKIVNRIQFNDQAAIDAIGQQLAR